MIRFTPMTREEIMDFLNPFQQDAVSTFEYLDNPFSEKCPLRNGFYVRFIDHKFNYCEGGVISSIKNYPMVKIFGFDKKSRAFDATCSYVFYKRGHKLSKRDQFELLLEDLEKNQLKKS
jgi:hypothetical protein